ncbi:MAG: hypothetical protein ABIH23_32260, partial [bacterium]
MKRFLLSLAVALMLVSLSVPVNAQFLSQQILNNTERLMVTSNLPPIAGKWYYADMKSGKETNPGTSPATAVCSLQTAYSKCVAGRGDGVCLLADSTSYSFTVSKPCTLSKMNTTIYGATANKNPYFNRVRVTTKTKAKASSLPFIFVVTGYGVSIINLHASNGDTLGFGCLSVENARS